MTLGKNASLGVVNRWNSDATQHSSECAAAASDAEARSARFTAMKPQAAATGL